MTAAASSLLRYALHQVCGGTASLALLSAEAARIRRGAVGAGVRVEATARAVRRAAVRSGIEARALLAGAARAACGAGDAADAAL